MFCVSSFSKQSRYREVFRSPTFNKKMLNGYFQGFIMNKYKSYNVFDSAFKYIHYDLTNARGLKIITQTFTSIFVTTFPPRPNVVSFVHIQKFGITSKNKFEHMDSGFVLRVGASTTINQIDPFPITLQFILTHSIHEFMQRLDLENLDALKVVGLQTLSF